MSLSRYIIIFLAITTNVYALIIDNKKPIDIEAKEAEMNKKIGITTYTGNVIITQGSLKLTANKVDIFHDEKDVKKIIAIGDNKKLAQYKQQRDKHNDYIYAEAISITYLVNDNFIKLRNKASLKRGEIDSFSGDYLDYDIAKDKVLAKKSKTGKDRVKFRIKVD